MQQVQFISVTPQQLQEAIIQGVKIQLDELKKSFEPKTPIEYLSRQETAELLKVDLSSIHNWTKRKILKSYGISGRVYYKRSEIENAMVELKK
ncbi:MAG: helix-turn-helix domain-containing protein [Lutibacter sp.]|nr:helix-turn-helix domain-containing protein [Lutibacter sp.]